MEIFMMLQFDNWSKTRPVAWTRGSTYNYHNLDTENPHQQADQMQLEE